MYKLKALRDRQFDLREKGAVMGYARAEWLRSKIIKDGSDLISLLDPNPDPYIVNQELNPDLIRNIIEEFNLDFCIDSISSLPLMRDSHRQYRYIDDEIVKKWASDLTSYLS